MFAGLNGFIVCSSDIFVLIRWHGEFRNCRDLFKMIKTDDGFCCSFNTINIEETFVKEEAVAGTDDDDYYYYYYDSTTDHYESTTSNPQQKQKTTRLISIVSKPIKIVVVVVVFVVVIFVQKR